ncbi:hypothetical protein DPMN_164748 [Dreissena polymorpha]|uniref:Uncharacterized protein n=1 Tax=Dreissena polymorpha TaxID=45954 RepID=A0A9D4EYD4_DREPO|nr:hypothetical protein DPMN_164748 [Dreissena polymorpha]
MSMSELARHSSQLDIRDFFRMSMSKLDRHSLQRNIRDFFRMSISELARHSGIVLNVNVKAGSTFAPARYSFFAEC